MGVWWRVVVYKGVGWKDMCKVPSLHEQGSCEQSVLLPRAVAHNAVFIYGQERRNKRNPSGQGSWESTIAQCLRVSPPDPRPEGRESRLFFDFLGREWTFFRNSLQGEGREWEKETPCGRGLGSWDT